MRLRYVERSGKFHELFPRNQREASQRTMSGPGWAVKHPTGSDHRTAER